MRKRPNILFITSDQHRGDSYGFRGRKVKHPATLIGWPQMA